MEELLGLNHDVMQSEGSLEDPRCKVAGPKGTSVGTRSLTWASVAHAVGIGFFSIRHGHVGLHY